MFMTYSSSKERRYRYFVCYRAQQKVAGYCTTRAVSAPAVEEAVVESIRRVGVHPRVLAETAREARQHLADSVTALREELKGVHVRVKNLKSQLARLRQPSDAERVVSLQEQIAGGERRAGDLKQEILRREQQRLAEKELRETLKSFEEVWKTLNLREQSHLVRQLVEKVGVDGRTGKVTVSFKSAALKALCQKGAA
jgi:site-specific DNA recombinase